MCLLFVPCQAKRTNESHLLGYLVSLTSFHFCALHFYLCHVTEPVSFLLPCQTHSVNAELQLCSYFYLITPGSYILGYISAALTWIEATIIPAMTSTPLAKSHEPSALAHFLSLFTSTSPILPIKNPNSVCQK